MATIKRLYQHKINSDNVPAKIQILEDGPYNEGHLEGSEFISTEYEQYNNEQHQKKRIFRCRGCKNNFIGSSEYEYHTNNISLIAQDSNTHTLKETCQLCNRTTQSTNNHTFKNKYTYAESYGDNQYHYEGYICDMKNLGCKGKEGRYSENHSYWKDYGETFYRAAPTLECSECGHTFQPQPLTDIEISIIYDEVHSIRVAFNQDITSQVKVEITDNLTLETLLETSISPDEIITFDKEPDQNGFTVLAQATSKNLLNYCHTEVIKNYTD